jgi:hypothetical protein
MVYDFASISGCTASNDVTTRELETTLKGAVTTKSGALSRHLPGIAMKYQENISINSCNCVENKRSDVPGVTECVT